MRGISTVFLLVAAGAIAQDAQRVASPDGQIEFRLFIDQPERGALFRLAYRIDYHGEPLLNTSFMALRIHNQEPDLGDNVGLTGARTVASKQYNTLLAEYMQNGSLGRRINVEARVYNEGVAFRYVIPESTPLSPMLLDNELTEFAFAGNADAIAKIAPGSMIALPFVTEQPGVGWVAVDEARGGGSYPRMYITRQDGDILISRLPLRPDESNLAWGGATPMTCPWRVVAIGATRQQVSESNLARSLNP